ncbi:hypothetical protein KSS94_22815 [Pseudomonas fakonensis]|uniref:Transcriptional regulator n=1 Tax=Pseudomonas fakonensis TaxID=2842355 RepID=A0ABX8N482_9PSED|nr:hypothetical protein [Pseudomonas fakonensis]QXH50747.1 hypothetical protein KSS94_22815 [Pseudomonas fakonensis]
MKSAKQHTAEQAMAHFEAQARRLVGEVSRTQLRLLQVAKEKGVKLEPGGRMAG